ncbi:MAG: OmpA family protein [Rhodospirillaceae bacterium]|nr:OmpA family protein [Rhodospirillaceae bacterium]MBL6942152.1 OmpA family protein [Rhodospirillales bacterium]
MDLFQSNSHFTNARPTIMGALAAISLVLASSDNATAQQDTYVDFSHPNVTIDLSVIDNGGYQPATGAEATVFGGRSGIKLIMPGSQAPTSMLHVPTVSGKTLVLPKKQKPVQTAAKNPKPAPVVEKAPAPAPTPVKLAATAKPTITPAAAPEVKKAPPAAPVVNPAPKVAKAEVPKAPPPPPAPKAEKTVATEQAAMPAASAAIGPGQALRVTFTGEQTKLPAAAKDGLTALANKMKGQETVRLQLMAYAGGPSLSSSLARRMSLSRALAVRSFLIESGVRSTRIDVRALGNKTTEKPINRVDLNVTER